MEVVTIVGLAFQTLAIVDRAVELFNRLQNAPREIRMVRILLAQIGDSLKVLEPYVGPSGLITISTDQENEIRDVLNDCKTFLAQYSGDIQAQGLFGRVYWSATHGRELTELMVRMERINPNIITPLMFQLILARTPTGIFLPRGQPAPAVLEAQAEGLLPAATQLLLPNGGANANIPVPENGTREAELRLQEYRTILGLRLRDILDTSAVATDTDFRNICGATLFLQDPEIPPEYRTLSLDRLQVAARDEETTVLHFRCNGGAIRIKHLVPRLSDITSLEVSFRATHAITLMCPDGHHLFNITGPRYRFIDLTTRRRFQSLVRGRELVDEFEASEIAALSGSAEPRWLAALAGRTRSRCLAVGEPLQVWRWDRPGLGLRMTMTFLAKTAGGFDHLELHFGDRVGEVQIVKAAGSSKRKAVQGQWVIPKLRAHGARFTFRNEKG